MFSNPEAEKEFKKNERKLVKERRDKYANRVEFLSNKEFFFILPKDKAKIREVVSTDVQERMLRATMMIQKWFKNRKSVIARKATNPDGQRPNLPPAIMINNKGKNEETDEIAVENNESKKKERRKRGFLF